MCVRDDVITLKDRLPYYVKSPIVFEKYFENNHEQEPWDNREIFNQLIKYMRITLFKGTQEKYGMHQV